MKLRPAAGRFPAAESSYRRAPALNPSLAIAHHFYSVLLAACCRNEESFAEVHAGLEADPLCLPLNNAVGWMYFAARQYDSAIAASRKTLEMDSA